MFACPKVRPMAPARAYAGACVYQMGCRHCGHCTFCIDHAGTWGIGLSPPIIIKPCFSDWVLPPLTSRQKHPPSRTAPPHSVSDNSNPQLRPRGCQCHNSARSMSSSASAVTQPGLSTQSLQSVVTRIEAIPTSDGNVIIVNVPQYVYK
jgi:hypothetical protein